MDSLEKKSKQNPRASQLRTQAMECRNDQIIFGQARNTQSETIINNVQKILECACVSG